MNGKKAKFLRKCARSTATSHNDYSDKRSSNTRRLVSSSLKRILKLFKVRYKITPRPLRNRFAPVQ